MFCGETPEGERALGKRQQFRVGFALEGKGEALPIKEKALSRRPLSQKSMLNEDRDCRGLGTKATKSSKNRGGDSLFTRGTVTRVSEGKGTGFPGRKDGRRQLRILGPMRGKG